MLKGLALLFRGGVCTAGEQFQPTLGLALADAADRGEGLALGGAGGRLALLPLVDAQGRTADQLGVFGGGEADLLAVLLQPLR